MRLTIAAAALCCASTAFAQLSLTSQNTPVTEDFTGFAGSGFSPTPAAGQLDSDTFSTTGFGTNVAFGATATSGDPARGSSSGGESTGGIYAFDIGGGDITLGIQPGGADFTPGDILVRVQNNTGAQIDSVDISYNVSVFNDQPRANTLNFAWSTDEVTFTPEATLDFTSPEVADMVPSWASVSRNITLMGLAADFQAGDTLTLRFTGDDSSGSGSRDEFAIDDISIEATSVPVDLESFSIE